MSTKVAFPLPPPTNNTLTPQQRSQLLRSTKKLGRILGSTPHLIDDCPPKLSPLHVDLPFRSSKPKHRGEKSLFAHSPTSSISSSSSSRDTSSISSVDSPPSSPIERVKPHRPFLRLHTTHNALASSRPTLETIPGSPSPYRTTHDTNLMTTTPPMTKPRSNTMPSSSPRSPLNTRPNSILNTPAFNIPSDASLRLAKMERLRKRLGDGVPVEMVFAQPEPESPTRRPTTSPTSLTFDDSYSLGSPRASSFTKVLETIEESEPRSSGESKWYDSSKKEDKKKRKKMSDKNLWN